MKTPRTTALKETDLYPPIRDFLQKQGYSVQGEVNHCDLVAVRDDEPALIVELKTKLNLEVVMQAADRLALTESVYIAFPDSSPLWRRHWRRVRKLCQRLGVGIITLAPKTLAVKVRLDPLPYSPRRDRKRGQRLLAEFEHRVSHANVGGSAKTPLMTVYREDALRCVLPLTKGPLRLADLRLQSKVARAGSILQHNHYGWFERVAHGTYQLSPKGVDAATRYNTVIRALSADTNA